MPKHTTAEVCDDGLYVRFKELLQGVDCGVCRLAVNLWDCGVSEALDELIDGGGCQGSWGEEVINN